MLHIAQSNYSLTPLHYRYVSVCQTADAD